MTTKSFWKAMGSLAFGGDVVVQYLGSLLKIQLNRAKSICRYACRSGLSICCLVCWIYLLLHCRRVVCYLTLLYALLLCFCVSLFSLLHSQTQKTPIALHGARVCVYFEINSLVPKHWKLDISIQKTSFYSHLPKATRNTMTDFDMASSDSDEYDSDDEVCISRRIVI